MDPPTLLRHVTPLLLCDNEEAIIEAARLYGNFSRLAAVRQYMHECRVVEALLLLLDHSNSEVLYSVCGTLINLTVDSERKEVLVGECGAGGGGRSTYLPACMHASCMHSLCVGR